MKFSYDLPTTEPEQTNFIMPSEKEHLFTINNLLEDIDPNPTVVHVKLEVTGGDEEGRTLLHRLNLDAKAPEFFLTRIFLKAICLEYKGKINIDTDNFQARQFYATVIHNEAKTGKIFANIDKINFDKIVEQPIRSEMPQKTEVGWDDDVK